MAETESLAHKFDPVYNKESRVLVLGTFPSAKSREMNFYYGHPQNRFWRVVAALTKQQLPQDVPARKNMLLSVHIAVWDVVKSCTITGAADASIRDVVPNDINQILKEAPIRQIFANGAKAYELYRKYQQPLTKKEAVRLPSTSPANAACSFEKLCEAWQVITEFLL